jgi:hypothetical protein
MFHRAKVAEQWYPSISQSVAQRCPQRWRITSQAPLDEVSVMFMGISSTESAAVRSWKPTLIAVEGQVQ